MTYEITIENISNSVSSDKKIIDLSVISPSNIAEPDTPYIEYIADVVDKLDGYIYIPLYNRNQYCVLPPNSILTLITENSDEAVFYCSQELTGAKIDGNPNPITGIVSRGIRSLSEINSDSVVPKSVVIDYIYRSMSDVTIPESVETLGYGAFGYCESLTEITIPANVTTIGKTAFIECTALQTVIFNEGLTSIGDNAFNNCSNLQEITLPNSLRTLGGSCFTNCSSLSSVNIPTSLTTINSYTFGNCTALTEITIPENITSIVSTAFNGCTNLLNIYVDKASGSISGAPWGATNATVTWKS